MITREDELIDFCRQLVAIESLSGAEEKAAEAVRLKMLELGFDEAWIDPNGSVIGKIKGGKPGPAILFDGHIDTVPVSDHSKWTFDPFGGEIDGGKIYGRGTSDMKGAVAAMVYAAAELKRSGGQWAGDIYVSGTVYEEVFEGVSLKTVMEAVRPDLVVIGESTGLNLNIGQRGRAEVHVQAYGKTAHSSNPQFGVNAVTGMLPFLSRLSELPPKEHVQLGQGISVVTDIISSPYPGKSVVPDKCAVTIDRRLLTGEDERAVLDEYRQLAEPGMEVAFAEQSLPCYTGAQLTSKRFYPAWLMEVDHPYVQMGLKALHKAGIEAKIGSYQFCTNGSYSAGIAGIPTVGFGPSYEHMAHVVDEYVEINQLIKAAEGYYAIAKAFSLQSGGIAHV